jgi:hypothetical protein
VKHVSLGGLILSRCGLGPAEKALACRSPVPVRLRAEINGPLPDPVETGDYYIVGEALANAAKHANATIVDISIEQRGQFLTLAVRDDGVGGADPNGPGQAAGPTGSSGSVPRRAWTARCGAFGTITPPRCSRPGSTCVPRRAAWVTRAAER